MRENEKDEIAFYHKKIVQLKLELALIADNRTEIEGLENQLSALNEVQCIEEGLFVI